MRLGQEDYVFKEPETVGETLPEENQLAVRTHLSSNSFFIHKDFSKSWIIVLLGAKLKHENYTVTGQDIVPAGLV